MSSTVDEVLASLDNLHRFEEGEWTADGWKKVFFRIDKIAFFQQASGYVEGGRGKIRVLSCFLLEMWDAGTSPAILEIVEGYNFQDMVIDEQRAAIGYCEPDWRYAKIYIDRESFDNIARSIAAFQQRGTIDCEIHVRKLNDKTQLLVTDFRIKNSVAMKSFVWGGESKESGSN